jgi:hypothetical protein
MASKKKSWNEKLFDAKDLPKIEKVPTRMQKRFGKGTMYIPAPMQVNEIMKTVPEGKIITINKIREILATRNGTCIACPITTGIFAWIAANASVEGVEQGKQLEVAYWRTLKEGGEINEKYPGGIEVQAVFLEREGHSIIQKGKRWIVTDWEQSLVK